MGFDCKSLNFVHNPTENGDCDKTKQAKLKLVILIIAPLMLVTDTGVEIPGMLVMTLIY